MICIIKNTLFYTFGTRGAESYGNIRVFYKELTGSLITLVHPYYGVSGMFLNKPPC